MNNAMLIGNLTKAPELRATQSGVPVCVFTIAVNRRGKDGGTDYFRITTWRGLADICAKYLSKGSKVGVVGAVSLNVYETNSGKTHATIEVNASEVEFLTPKSDADDTGLTYTEPVKDAGFIQVVDDDSLPF